MLVTATVLLLVAALAFLVLRRGTRVVLPRVAFRGNPLPQAALEPVPGGDFVDALHGAVFDDARTAEVGEVRAALVSMLDDDMFQPSTVGETDAAANVWAVNRAARLAMLDVIRKSIDAHAPRFFHGLEVLEAVAAATAPVLSVRVALQHIVPATAMTSLGGLLHRDAAEEVRTLRAGACIAAWEANGGGPSTSATTATFDSLTDEFVLDTPSDAAVKVGVIGCPDTGTRYAVVTARLITFVLVTDGNARPDGDRTRLDCGVHAFLCPLRRRDGSATPGVAVSESGHWRGLPGVRTGTVRFVAVRVPRSALLTGLGVSVSRSGEYHSPFASVQAHEHALKSTLLASRMGAVVCCLGTARRSLALLLNRLVKPLDVPITDPQPLVSTRLLARTDIAASVATAVVLRPSIRLLAGYVQQQLVWGGPQGLLFPLAALGSGLSFMHVVNKLCVEVCEASSMACGAVPLSLANELAQAREGVHGASMAIGGTPSNPLTAGRLLVQQQLQHDNGPIAYFSGKVADMWADLTSVLRGYPSLLDVFVAREERLRATLAWRATLAMRRGANGLQDVPPEWWVGNKDLLVALAEAHGERHVLQAFLSIAALQPGTTTSASPLLSQVATLFALSRIEAGARWFLWSGALDSGTIVALRSHGARLRRIIAVHLPVLLTAVGSGIRNADATGAGFDDLALG